MERDGELGKRQTDKERQRDRKDNRVGSSTEKMEDSEMGRKIEIGGR